MMFSITTHLFSDNNKFAAFRDALEKAGVTFQILWEARRNPDATYPDIAMVRFFGNGFSPNIREAIILDLGADGYSLYIPGEQSLSIDDDVALIGATPYRATMLLANKRDMPR